MSTQEFDAKYLRRFYGKRRARVHDNKDPDRLGKIKVICEELYGSTPSPWATPCFPFFGGRGSGFVSIPPEGSLVWIECEEGHVNSPIYTGGFFEKINDGHHSDGSLYEDSDEFQSETSSMPAHSRGDYDGSDFSMKGRDNVPPSSFQGEYTKVTTFQTSGGHMIEMDDTERGQRIQIHHSKGSHIEIAPDGTINIISESGVFTKSKSSSEQIETTHNKVIGGDRSKTVQGRETSTIGGDSISVIGGDLRSECNNLVFNSLGDFSLDTNSVGISALNLFSLDVGGDLNLSSFGSFEVVSAGEGSLLFTTTTPGSKGVEISALGALGSGLIEISSQPPSLSGGGLLPAQGIINGTNMTLFLQSLLTALRAVAVGLNTNFTLPVVGGPNAPLTAAGAVLSAAIETMSGLYLTEGLPTYIQSSTVKASI